MLTLHVHCDAEKFLVDAPESEGWELPKCARNGGEILTDRRVSSVDIWEELLTL